MEKARQHEALRATDQRNKPLTTKQDIKRVEYRIVGERRDGTPWQGSPQAGPSDNWDFQNSVRELSRRNNHVRVQKRTVTETPWTEDSP